MSNESKKIKLGITLGDFNGIGTEVMLKTFQDNKMFNYCIPIVYGSTKVISYHKKSLNLDKLNYQVLKQRDFSNLAQKYLNIINCWDEDIIINLGQPSAKAGECAIIALDEALKDLLAGQIDALVTAPLNKSQVKIEGKEFTGHTAYITEKCGVSESLMLLVSDNFRIGLVTEHIPLKEVSEHITSKKIYTKLEILHQSLEKDFALNKPRIAVFGLNPHAGENGKVGKEEKEIIIPTIEKARENGILAFGPYSADGLMGSGQYKKFDALLAMYHDQGLVAFKSISFGSGVNYTAGLPIIRTSPDHGTAYELVGKNEADHGSFTEAVFLAIDVYNNRTVYNTYTKNPLKKQKLSQD